MSIRVSLKLGPERGGGRWTEGPIEVASYTFSGFNMGIGISGQGTGKPRITGLHFQMIEQPVIVYLYRLCEAGRHLVDAQFDIVLDSGKSARYHMTDVLVDSFQAGGSGGAESPLCAVSLSFAGIGFDSAPPASAPQTPKTGAVGRAVLASFRSAVAKP